MKKSFKSRKSNFFNIYGINPTVSLLNNKPELICEMRVVRKTTNERLLQIISMSENLGITVQEFNKDTLDKIACNSKHQGVVATIRAPNFKNINHLKVDAPLISTTSTIAILDSIEDTGNLGAAIRTSYAAGINSIIIKQEGSAKINEHVFKSSVGAIFNVNLYIVPNINQAIDIIKSAGFWVIGLDEKSDQSIYEYLFDKKVAIIMGSESKGLRSLTTKNCDHILSIPMNSSLDSLNVSVALGIVAFEINRQRN